MEDFDLNEIHWHDSIIREVRVLYEHGTVDLHLDYPIDWQSDSYEPRIVRFIDAYGYKENEGPFVGCPTALEASSQRVGDWLLVRIDTNAGYRELYCKSFSLVMCAG